MSGYLTPNALPAGVTCRVLFIPDDEQFLANVRGLLEQFTFPSTFTPFGALTPEQTAAAYVPMFDKFCFNEGICRMIGEVVLYAGNSGPGAAFLLCDGASVLRADYPDLFAVIGTVYGAADGSHFNLPDLRGRAALSQGTGPGLSPRAVGDSFGEENHQLTVAELASHMHTTGNSLLLGTVTPPPLDALGPNPFPASTGSTGGDAPHNNMQPSLVLSYYIVASNG